MWFSPKFSFGRVESVADPMGAGRVLVRLHGIHSPDKNKLPDEFLPWAKMCVPATSASVSGTGLSPTGLEVGSDVMCMTLSDDPTDIWVLFSWGTVGDINPLAYGRSTALSSAIEEARLKDIPVSKSNNFTEPSIDRSATAYPYNDVKVSRNGFVVEDDGSGGTARRAEMHPKGSYRVWENDGSITERCKRWVHIAGEAFINIVNGTMVNVCSSNFVQRIAADFYTAVTGQATVVSAKGLQKHSEGLEIQTPEIRTDANVRCSGVIYVPELHVGTIYANSIQASDMVKGPISNSAGKGAGDLSFDMTFNDNGGDYPGTETVTGKSGLPLSYELNKPVSAGEQVLKYWTNNRLDEVAGVSGKIAAKLYDTSIELNPDGCWQIVQRALNAMNRGQVDWTDVEVNGTPNDETMEAFKAAIGKRGEDHVFTAFNGVQFAYYVEKCEADPTQRVNFNKWVSGEVEFLKIPTVKEAGDNGPTI